MVEMDSEEGFASLARGIPDVDFDFSILPLSFGVNFGPSDDLPQNGMAMAEFVWMGASGTSESFRHASKTKTLLGEPASTSDQAPGENREVCCAQPIFLPILSAGGDNILVSCNGSL